MCFGVWVKDKESSIPKLILCDEGSDSYSRPPSEVAQFDVNEHIESKEEDKPKKRQTKRFPDETGEELETLFDLIKTHGFSWKKISAFMDNKPENCLKNKFYGEVRKILRVLNKQSVQVMKKRSKPLKYESLIRIFNIAEGGGIWEKEIQSLAHELRQALFQLILTFRKDKIQNFNEIMEKIQLFNKKTKHHAILKKKLPAPKKNPSEIRPPQSEMRGETQIQLAKSDSKQQVKPLKNVNDLLEFNEGSEDELPFSLSMWNQNILQGNDLEQQLNQILRDF